MPYIPSEVVSRAKQMDLYTYLRSYEPQELVHLGGGTYCTREHENHEIYDIIAGPAFICDCSGESFGSLSDEQIKKYSRQFMRPERFYSTRDGGQGRPVSAVSGL